ncbi:hypothetical protein PM022_17815 [Halorubrum ezzemoulense]|uniref:hypothetical protein n=1 Tax=Halorubrum ezzemoulense TaxID=337243 RepID=UPI00232E0E4E|nr:hypothetical protein [Halorubrum ezzemoulense]MDB2276356.1 hypothetical protein [Halorubrum ezzemoulense]
MPPSEQESGDPDQKEALKSFLSIEFVVWLAVFVPAFVVFTLFFRALDVPTWFVLDSGMLFGEVTNRTESREA